MSKPLMELRNADAGQKPEEQAGDVVVVDEEEEEEEEDL